MTASNEIHTDWKEEKNKCNGKSENQSQNNPKGDDFSVASSDEALMEMLGLSSLSEVAIVDDESDESGNANQHSPLPTISDDNLQRLATPLHHQYQTESVCIFPQQCSIPPDYMRELTEELVWGGPSVQADRTYENIQILKRDGTIEHRRTLTRLEHFVDAHEGWSELCHEYLRRLVSAALGTDMVLYKEKLNLKPPGGSGFAPHLDTPSLRVALGQDGPQTFCTVMVAIDGMNAENGCLRICKGNWGEENHCELIQPELNGDPDAGGRAGAIPLEAAENMTFDKIICKGGAIVCFNGWAPHRSAANASPFPRRAVFLTYNPKSEGDCHRQYYANMQKLRDEWREKVGLANRQQRLEDEKLEQAALATVPS